MAEITGPGIITNFITENKTLIITLAVIFAIIFLLRWWKMVQDKLDRIN